MHYRVRIIALALVCLACSASVARAQDETDPAEAARFKIGTLRFTPSIVLSNLGVDNNVFNEADDPKQDTTAAIGPAVNLWMKMGKSGLSGKLSGQYLYFKEYENQRAWNTVNDGKWEVPLSRITPFITGAWSDVKDRPGYEIDSRVRLKEQKAGAGSGIRLSGKTELRAGFQRGFFRYDDKDLVVGDAIARGLDRRTDTEIMDLRVRLTPLTTFAVQSTATQERFDNQDFRDANTVAVLPGFDFKPEALISGSAFVGVKRFTSLRDEIPDFTGVVANVGTKYILRSTQFDVRVSRDLAFSYQVLQPYYALVDTGLTVTQRITYKWDVIGRSSWQSLAYRNVTSTINLAERTDHSWQLGGGLAYRIGEILRVGLDANYYRRDAPEAEYRNFEGLRVGASFSYGLPQ
jgi:hypothetical protein